MDAHSTAPKHKPSFYLTIPLARGVASWVTKGLVRWSRFTEQRALQRFENLNDRALRDIGLWREPESRLDEWWMMNPPP